MSPETVGLALLLLGVLLLTAKLVRVRWKLTQRLYLPGSIIGGGVALLLGPDVFGRLAPGVQGHAVLVAESGITGVADVQRFVSEGAGVVLVGEALVKDGDPEAAVRAMTGVTTP